MPDLLDMLDNMQSLDIKAMAGDTLNDNKSEFIKLNKEQLLEGKLSTGKDIYPTYFDDPYFKSPESAKRYSDWKDRITPNPKRKKGVPNLYIVGSYHGSIEMEVAQGEYEIKSEFKDAQSIEAKFSNDIYGLTDESKDELIEGHLRGDFYQKAHEQLGIE